MDSIGVEGRILRGDACPVPPPPVALFPPVSPLSPILSSARLIPIEMGQVRRVKQFWVLSSEFLVLTQSSALIVQRFRRIQNLELKTQNFSVTHHSELRGFRLLDETR